MPNVASSGSAKDLRSWQQMMTVLRNTGKPLTDLFVPGLLGGPHSPVRMPHVSAQQQGQAVEYVIFTYFKQARSLLDACFDEVVLLAISAEREQLA